MRILQIVSLFSPDNAYGGPVTVALNQSKSLIAAGHEVTLLGTFRDDLSPPRTVDSVPAELFRAYNVAPRLGFAGQTSLPLLRWIHNNAAAFDAVHVHVARDFLTLPAALISMRAEIPTFLQTHGMMDRSSHLLAKPLDLFATRPALRKANTVFVLTPAERVDVEAVAGPGVRTRRLINGVPGTNVRAPVSVNTEVLYLARLQSRKRPQAFLQAAARLLDDFPEVKFTLVGPDEGEGTMVQQFVEQLAPPQRVSWEGPTARGNTISRMTQASLYVLPAVNEPYPMSVLEAMSVALPVVVTDSCGLADEIDRAGAGIVVSDDIQDLTAAIARLLSDPGLRLEMGERGRELVATTFSMEKVVGELVLAYGA